MTPTHFVPQIIAALDQARKKGLNLPIVYNTSGYEKVETLRRLNGYVDVYLPDFKYLDPEHAKKYSGAEDYPEVAKAALEEMCIRDRCGYDREIEVAGPGQFAVRGGILDVYPLTEELPVRIELWGDEVDSIRTFDPVSYTHL